VKGTRHSITLICALPVWFNLVFTLVHVGYRSHYGVDSNSNGNEYQVYFLKVKAAGFILCCCHEIW